MFLIIDITKKMPVLKEDLLDPAIMLTAWLHQHGLVCDSLADELLSRARDESNIAGLKRFFRSVGTLGDLLNNHQLQELMKVIPDIDTLENLLDVLRVFVSPLDWETARWFRFPVPRKAIKVPLSLQSDR